VQHLIFYGELKKDTGRFFVSVKMSQLLV